MATLFIYHSSESFQSLCLLCCLHSTVCCWIYWHDFFSSYSLILLIFTSSSLVSPFSYFVSFLSFFADMFYNSKTLQKSPSDFTVSSIILLNVFYFDYEYLFSSTEFRAHLFVYHPVSYCRTESWGHPPFLPWSLSPTAVIWPL
jgi:hypothetical protein